MLNRLLIDKMAQEHLTKEDGRLPLTTGPIIKAAIKPAGAKLLFSRNTWGSGKWARASGARTGLPVLSQLKSVVVGP